MTYRISVRSLLARNVRLGPDSALSDRGGKRRPHRTRVRTESRLLLSRRTIRGVSKLLWGQTYSDGSYCLVSFGFLKRLQTACVSVGCRCEKDFTTSKPPFLLPTPIWMSITV